MITAPTGQAVFDPFAPPTTMPPQPMVTEPAVIDPAINPANDPTIDQSSVDSADHINATPSDQLDQLTDQPHLVSSSQLSDDGGQNQTSTNSYTPTPATGTPATQMLAVDEDQAQDFDLTEDERLALFDQVLTEAEQASSVFDQVMPAAIIANDPLNPQGINPSGARKPETVASNSAVPEAGLIGQVELEPASELPVEVEGFLERVEDHADKLPQELVVADGNVQALPQSHPTQTVIVLPITAEDEQHPVKDVKLSFTWLLEWSHKIIKKFVGKVVYRHESQI